MIVSIRWFLLCFWLCPKCFGELPRLIPTATLWWRYHKVPYCTNEDTEQWEIKSLVQSHLASGQQPCTLPAWCSMLYSLVLVWHIQMTVHAVRFIHSSIHSFLIHSFLLSFLPHVTQACVCCHAHWELGWCCLHLSPGSWESHSVQNWLSL